MRRSSLVGAALGAVLLVTGCFGPDPDITPEGKGFPELAIEFPAATEAGSVETATLTIVNPGPAEMGSVVVAFSRLGDPQLPLPVVEVTARGEQSPVRDVEPAPEAVSQDGVVYRFGSLAEGETLEVTFELAVPDIDGPAGNAVLVYDGREPDRARGVRLETEVEG